MQGKCAARLAQSVEHQTFNLRVMGSSPISGDYIFCVLKNEKSPISGECSFFWTGNNVTKSVVAA